MPELICDRLHLDLSPPGPRPGDVSFGDSLNDSRYEGTRRTANGRCVYTVHNLLLSHSPWHLLVLGHRGYLLCYKEKCYLCNPRGPGGLLRVSDTAPLACTIRFLSLAPSHLTQLMST